MKERKSDSEGETERQREKQRQRDSDGESMCVFACVCESVREWVTKEGKMSKSRRGSGWNSVRERCKERKKN